MIGFIEFIGLENAVDWIPDCKVSDPGLAGSFVSRSWAGNFSITETLSPPPPMWIGMRIDKL